MADTQDFIQLAARNLETSEETMRSATGGILQLIQQQVSSSDFQHLLERLAGAEEVLEASAQTMRQVRGGEGMLGSLMSQAAALVGGNVGSVLGVMGLLKQSGLGTSKAGPFVALFINFVRESAGTGLRDRILDRLPELKKLIG